MNWLVFHIASGHAFFTGIAFLAFAGFASTRSHRIFPRLAGLAFVVGVIFVAISSTPIPYWYYGVAAVLSAFWIACQFKDSWRSSAAFALVGVWVVAAAIELPFHIHPTLHSAPDRSVTVIGDSVTAGVGGSETAETWPNIIAREHQLNVQDISHVGETAASALRRAQSTGISSRIVVVEIGGNDILGSTSPRKFAQDLDGLLKFVGARNRQIVMFELPLPPFHHEYGRIQRQLAAKHDVYLVPKRVFLSVIAGGDATLDTIHLSQSGHEAMADRVWNIIQPAVR